MKKTILTALILALAFNSYSLSNHSNNDPQANQTMVQLTGTGIKICLTDYIKLSPGEYKKLTGKRLKWKEAISLKITQKRIKKTIRKDGTVDMNAYQTTSKKPFKFHWGGFFLGLLLPIVGMVVAALIKKDDKKSDRVTSAAIGTLIVCVAALIFFLSEVSSY